MCSDVSFVDKTAREEAAYLVKDIGRLLTYLAMNVPALSNPTFSVNLSTRLGIKRTLSRIDDDGTCSRVAALTISGSVDLWEMRDAVLSTATEPWPYWTCEIRCYQGAAGPCVKSPEGEEMAVCAGMSLAQAPHLQTLSSTPRLSKVPSIPQCLSVRYCSKGLSAAHHHHHQLPPSPPLPDAR